MVKLDFRTDFKVGQRVYTVGIDKLLGVKIPKELVTIIEVRQGYFKYLGQYEDGETYLFFEDELTAVSRPTLLLGDI